MCPVAPQHLMFGLHFVNPVLSLWIVTLVHACSTYRSRRSSTWAVPLQQSRLGPRWRCIRFSSPGSSARCGRCCLILGSAWTQNGVHSEVVRFQRRKRVSWHVFQKLQAWCLNYRERLSSSRWDVEDLVLTHVAFSSLPLDIQGAGGGVSDLEVPNATQRLCGTAKAQYH